MIRCARIECQTSFGCICYRYQDQPELREFCDGCLETIKKNHIAVRTLVGTFCSSKCLKIYMDIIDHKTTLADETRQMFPRSNDALKKFVSMPWTGRCLDLGCGDHEFVEALSSPNRFVETITQRTDDTEATYNCDFVTHYFPTKFDAVWCSHTLEHQLEPHWFLYKLRRVIKKGGYMAIVVPMPRTTLASGHVHEYTPGILILNLIHAGFDCSKASVLCTSNEVSVVMKIQHAILPPPESRDGEHLLAQLDPYFPIRAYEGMPAVFSINWV